MVGVGGFVYFGILTSEAIIRQRSFQATLLPATGVLMSGLLLAYTSSPATSTRSNDGWIATLSNFTFYQVDGRFFARKLGEEEETPVDKALFDCFTTNTQKVSDRGSWMNSFYYGRYLSQEDAQRLATLALTPNGDGSYPIVQWRPEDSSPLLRFDFEIPPVVQQQLFVRYAEGGYFSYSSIGRFVTRCPDAISAIRQLQKSPLVEAAQNPSTTSSVTPLIVAMRAKGVEFTPEELWIVRAADDSVDFEEVEFRALSEEEKESIYRSANGLRARKLIERLKTLGMGGSFDHRPIFKPMLAYEMDLIAAEGAMRGYLLSLRATGRLVTRSEFEQMNPERYMDKESDSFERILGADFIQTVAKQYNCPAVMVPRKIAVINGDPSELTIDLLRMSCPSIKVYAERVTRADQKCTVEEVVQLMRVIKHTGFSDFGFAEPNIFRTRGGFHFIDTEFNSFSGIATPLRTLQSCAKMVEEKDHPAIMSAAQEIFEEEQFGSQQLAATRTYFQDHPNRLLLHAVGWVTIPTREIFNPPSSSN